MPSLVILFGIVSAVAGWRGVSVISVIKSAVAGQPYPSYSAAGGIASLVAVPEEFVVGGAVAVGTAMGDAIKGIPGDIAKAGESILGDVEGAAKDVLPFLPLFP